MDYIIPTLLLALQVQVELLDQPSTPKFLVGMGSGEKKRLLRFACTISLLHLNLDTDPYLGTPAIDRPQLLTSSFLEIREAQCRRRENCECVVVIVNVVDICTWAVFDITGF